MEKKKVRVGFIGIGKMGNPMSKRLLEAGYPLTVYDVVKERTRELAGLGAKVAGSPEAVARQSDVVILSVPGDRELEDVCLGGQGVLGGGKPNSILIDMSTVTPASSARVAQSAERKKVRYLRAPVSGSTVLAAAGQLSVLVSGDEATYKECLPLFNILGKSVTYVGPGEDAKYMKLLVNMMLAVTSQMTAEALAFGERAGLDWKKMVDVINHSVVASPLIGYKARPLSERDFTPAFTVKQMEKDLDYALAAGRELGVVMPVTSLVRQFLAAAVATGKGDLDFFSLLLLMEEMSGIKKA